MSSILEALERAETEKTPDKPVSLHPVDAPKPRSNPGRKIWALVIILVLLNLLAWFNLISPENSTQPESRSEPASEITQQKPITTTSTGKNTEVKENRPPILRESDPPLFELARVPKTQQSLPPTPPKESGQTIHAKDEKEQEAIAATPSPIQAPPPSETIIATIKPVAAKPVAAKPVAAKPVAAKPVAAKPVTAKPVAAKPVAAKPVAAKPVAAKPVAVDSVATKSVAKQPEAAQPAATGASLPPSTATRTQMDTEPTGMEQQVPALTNIPLLWELPSKIQSRLRNLKLTIHVYNENAAKRFVIIGMKRYREGDNLPGKGLKLQHITKEGVVINYGKGLVRL